MDALKARRGGPQKAPEAKLKTISAAIRPTHYEMLLAQAVIQDRTMGEVLRGILDTWMACYQEIHEGQV